MEHKTLPECDKHHKYDIFLGVGRQSWQSVLNSWLTVSSSRLQTITTGEDSHQICCITQVFNFYEVKSVSSVYLSCWSFPVCQYNQNDPSCKHSIMFRHRVDAKIFRVRFAKHLRIKRNNESTCQLPCFTDLSSTCPSLVSKRKKMTITSPQSSRWQL